MWPKHAAGARGETVMQVKRRFQLSTTATTNAAITANNARARTGQNHHRPFDRATIHPVPVRTPTSTVPTNRSHRIASANAKAVTTTTKTTMVRLMLNQRCTMNSTAGATMVAPMLPLRFASPIAGESTRPFRPLDPP
jgi:hypothetical protein